jgi:uncharacterized membrane protein YkvA (DUF1232 family)
MGASAGAGARLVSVAHSLRGDLTAIFGYVRERSASVAHDLTREVAFCRAVYVDPHTPWWVRALLWLALAYAALPFDLIPDFVPIIGQLDDLLIVPGLVLLALRFVPREVYEQHRRRFFPSL